MGFFNKVKNVTGIGLNSNEAYHRAYEKGVLLAKYDTASDLFAKAAEKCMQDGQAELAQKARANQHLYSFIATKQMNEIDNILVSLNGLEEIEEIGSETETVLVSELRVELEARQFENAA